ncbi:hypothetical protein [Candidatus Phyllobacterium onerii]|uniref:hypothetical protein n=1 Tax=Candidatus Phyllobacterium onerii TaxID=3020828 RepID=UPI00232C840A|nr:hypothetical protein [Phyllobacterium sp. IY22]
MPAFFIPHAKDKDQTERMYESIKEYVGKVSGPVADERIYSISYAHNGKQLHSVVGEKDGVHGEEVIAILRASQSDLYFICTANRGVTRGDPILAGGGWQTVVQGFSANE